MEEVIQILVFIVIIASVVIQKYKEVNANRPGQCMQSPLEKDPKEMPNIEELGPIISLEEEDEEIFTDRNESAFHSLHQKSPMRCNYEKEKYEEEKFVEEKHETEILKNKKDTAIQPSILTNKNSKIRIKSRQEARQAFIYSEIFNRKYE